MRTSPLGQSGIEASVIGLGTWAIGGWMWGGTERGDAVRAVHAAIDTGVNLIDTAPIYGFGLSEQIVGEAIRDRRDRVVLATKCGMVCNTTRGDPKFRSDARGPNEDGHIAVRIYQHPDSIREEIEWSLRRLGTDRIDLYQTHWQDPTTPIEETMGTLLDLKREGKIRAIGVCNASAEQMHRYARVGPLDSDQEKYSMLDRDIEGDQLPFCRENELAVMAYSPLAMGLLTGRCGPERQFAPGDVRSQSERFSVENRRQVTAMLDTMRPVMDRHQASPAQLAIAWALHQPGLTHALCGARNPQQAQQNAAASEIELGDDELRQIESALDVRAGATA